MRDSNERFNIYPDAYPPLGNPYAGDLIGGDSTLGEKA